MQRSRSYDEFRSPEKMEQGGLIRISGKFLLDHESDIINLIKHQAKLAEEKNADHKINTLEKSDGSIVVTTSDHNLALHIGKALSSAYKGEHQYKFSKGEKFVEVDWTRD
ncbi:MAG: hypothetical protein ABIE84_03685 [bacterium]